MQDDLINGVMTFSQKTGDIQVDVQSYFLDEQSAPEQAQYMWAYRIKVSNEGDDWIQLIDRHWIITDARGNVREVRGDGVVGEQPVISGGQSYIYTSGTPLETPSGFMQGSYGIVDATGRSSRIDVPAFSLDSPHAQLKVN